MLADKMKDAEIISNDHETKKDIMSILVRARKAEMDGGKESFSMNDEAMVNQVVSSFAIDTLLSFTQLNSSHSSARDTKRQHLVSLGSVIHLLQL